MTKWNDEWHYYPGNDGDLAPMLIHSNEIEYACGLENDFDIEFKKIILPNPAELYALYQEQVKAYNESQVKLAAETRMRIGLAHALEAKGVEETWILRQAKDKEKAEQGGNLQLFCPDCKIGVTDEVDFIAGHVKECPQCGQSTFAYSWEFELNEVEGAPV